MPPPPPPPPNPTGQRTKYNRSLKEEKNTEEVAVPIPKDKRRWSIIHSLQEVVAVIDEYKKKDIKASEILVSLDWDGTISGRYSKEHNNTTEQTLDDQSKVQENAILFLENFFS